MENRRMPMIRWNVSGAWWVLAVALLLVALAPARAEEARQHRVVMHLNGDDERVQRGLLGNSKNLYEAVGRDSLRVEVVAHGPGLRLLTKKDSPLASEVADLKAKFGVEFTACSNTMKKMGLLREDLIEQVDRTVPAMVRLMELQEQGWAYIKP
ncbi:MAG: DsrE family protein [Nitrospiraceae bacterium]